MQSRAQVVIIGAGIMGASIAYHLTCLLYTSRPGETIITLDGKQQQLDAVGGTGSPALLVCDPREPLGVAGVMGLSLIHI